MKIVYVARHDYGQNDDEGAIAHAFRVLGHDVLPVNERDVPRGLPAGDVALFHHWSDCHLLGGFGGIKAFWHFDLVDWPDDPSLVARCAHRRERVRRATDVSDFGFLTDGDWVAADRTGKLHWLPQGADERIVSRADPSSAGSTDLLFTGLSRGGGAGREAFVAEMAVRYGAGFRHVPGGVYRERLRASVADSRIVVCPDTPVSDRYWSNRVWNACGFGGFVLHPRATELEACYADGREVVYYGDREELHDLIARWTDDARAAERRAIGDAALERTRRQHLYRHRVEELIRVVTGAAPAAPNPEAT